MAAARGVGRGDVFWVELVPRSGSEQRGRRPAIVVSHDVFNQADRWRSIIVVPLSTSRGQASRGPTAVALGAGEGGLLEDSVALCHQVTTLDRGKLAERLGRLSEEAIRSVDAGLTIALDLNRPRPDG